MSVIHDKDITMTNATTILRKGTLAYIGLYGTAFERAQTRYTKIRAFNKATRENWSENFGDAFAKTYTCGLARSRNWFPSQTNSKVDALESEVAELTQTLADLKKSAKKAAKKTAKKMSKKMSKKVVAKKKSSTKKATKPVTAKAKTVAPRHIEYLEKVRAYDVDASEAVVKKIVDHCGISLSNRDGKFVACGDESERVTVRDSWLKKKLGLEGTDAELDAKVLNVCEMMNADRLKSRVTFYYLLAKTEGKLNTL